MLPEHTIAAGTTVWLDVREGILMVMTVEKNTTFHFERYVFNSQSVMLDLFEYVDRHRARFASVRIQ